MSGTRSEGVVWDHGRLTRETRWGALGLHGATVWFTGLPASGKSSIAAIVEERLVSAGRLAYRLDGDNLRHGVNGDLGFQPVARDENVRRAGEVAKLFADAGAIAVVSLISPYVAARDRVRAVHDEAGLPFLEIWVSTPLEVCEARDPKGLYARARRGEIERLTGVNDPYEPPPSPDLELTHTEAPEAAAERVLAALAERGVPVTAAAAGR